MSAYDNWLTQPWEDKCEADREAEACTCPTCGVQGDEPLADGDECVECQADETEVTS